MVCQADNLYFQGFETDASGWYDNATGMPGSVTRTMGTALMPAASGSYYGIAQNTHDTFQPGYGGDPYTLFGNTGSSGQPYPGSAFTQSLAIYINPSTAAPTNPGTAAFWLDASPSASDPYDVANNGGMGYGAEHDFAFFYNGSTVTVTADDGAQTLGTIATAGWYDFQFLYSQSDSNPTDLSTTTLTYFDPFGIALGSTTLVNDDSTGVPLQNQYLGGPGYDWLTVWQNGFSNDQLAIDNTSADTVTPEPGTLLLAGIGIAGAACFRHRKRA